MQNNKEREQLNYVRIVGQGVDALENRKEHNNNTPVTADLLRTSINKVKCDLFAGFKQLSAVSRSRN